MFHMESQINGQCRNMCKTNFNQLIFTNSWLSFKQLAPTWTIISNLRKRNINPGRFYMQITHHLRNEFHFSDIRRSMNIYESIGSLTKCMMPKVILYKKYGKCIAIVLLPYYATYAEQGIELIWTVTGLTDYYIERLWLPNYRHICSYCL